MFLIKGIVNEEEAAGGGAGEARALAKVYGILATGGKELGLTPQTMAILTKHTMPPTEGIRDVVMGWETLGSSGGYAKPTVDFNFGSKSAFGFLGTGGSFAFADPKREIGIAYVMNNMDFYGENDPREVALRKAVYACIEQIENNALINVSSKHD